VSNLIGERKGEISVSLSEKYFIPLERQRGLRWNMILSEYKGTENLNLWERIKENTIAGEIPLIDDKKLIVRGYINPNEIKEKKSKERGVMDNGLLWQRSEWIIFKNTRVSASAFLKWSAAERAEASS